MTGFPATRAWVVAGWWVAGSLGDSLRPTIGERKCTALRESTAPAWARAVGWGSCRGGGPGPRVPYAARKPHGDAVEGAVAVGRNRRASEERNPAHQHSMADGVEDEGEGAVGCWETTCVLAGLCDR